MSDSVFNPDTFLEQEVEGALDTKVEAVPADEYTGQITSLKARTFTDKNDEARAVLDILWEVLNLDEDIKERLGLVKPMVKQTIFLDITGQGGLDMGKGKNVQLGKLRDALGQNADGRSWNPKQLVGGTAGIKVENTADKNDPEIRYANVVRVFEL